MRVLAGAAATLAGQLAVGAALTAVGLRLARGARAPVWKEVSRPLWLAAAVSVCVLVTVAAAMAATGGLATLVIRTTPSAWAHLSAGAAAAAGCYLLLLAGLLERRGGLAGSRRRARLGGWLLAIGAVGQSVTGLWSLARLSTGEILQDSPSRALTLGSASLLALLSAAALGVLAGLAGKPRPSCHASAALFVTSVVLDAARRA